jgi:hypothetical protein
MSKDSFVEYHDKPRYDVSLQKADELNCFVGFLNTASLAEAKAAAEEAAKESGRSVIVYDRKEYNIIFQIPAKEQPKPVAKEEPVEKKKKGKKK